MVAAWTIPTPLRAGTPSTGPAWWCAWRLRPGRPPRWSQRQRGVATVPSEANWLCEAEATEGRECVALLQGGRDGGRMDHTPAPPPRHALPLARLTPREPRTLWLGLG